MHLICFFVGSPEPSDIFVQNLSKEIEEEPTTGSELLRFARKA